MVVNLHLPKGVINDIFHMSSGLNGPGTCRNLCWIQFIEICYLPQASDDVLNKGISHGLKMVMEFSLQK